jgi:hypothetical protein
MKVISSQFSQVCLLADSRTGLPVTETAQTACNIRKTKREHIKSIRKMTYSTTVKMLSGYYKI